MKSLPTIPRSPLKPVNKPIADLGVPNSSTLKLAGKTPGVDIPKAIKTSNLPYLPNMGIGAGLLSKPYYINVGTEEEPMSPAEYLIKEYKKKQGSTLGDAIITRGSIGSRGIRHIERAIKVSGGENHNPIRKLRGLIKGASMEMMEKEAEVARGIGSVAKVLSKIVEPKATGPIVGGKPIANAQPEAKSPKATGPIMARTIIDKGKKVIPFAKLKSNLLGRSQDKPPPIVAVEKIKNKPGSGGISAAAVPDDRVLNNIRPQAIMPTGLKSVPKADATSLINKVKTNPKNLPPQVSPHNPPPIVEQSRRVPNSKAVEDFLKTKGQQSGGASIKIKPTSTMDPTSGEITHHGVPPAPAQGNSQGQAQQSKSNINLEYPPGYAEKKRSRRNEGVPPAPGNDIDGAALLDRFAQKGLGKLVAPASMYLAYRGYQGDKERTGQGEVVNNAVAGTALASGASVGTSMIAKMIKNLPRK